MLCNEIQPKNLRDTIKIGSFFCKLQEIVYFFSKGCEFFLGSLSIIMVIAILSTAEQNTVKGPWRKDVQCTKTFFFRHALLLEETFYKIEDVSREEQRAFFKKKLFATLLKLDFSDDIKENFEGLF